MPESSISISDVAFFIRLKRQEAGISRGKEFFLIRLQKLSMLQSFKTDYRKV